MSAVKKIQLLGLPGAGQTVVQQALKAYLSAKMPKIASRTGDFGKISAFSEVFEIEVPDFDAGRFEPVVERSLNIAVIDMRSFFDRHLPVHQSVEQFLQQLLLQCDGVIWSFVEAASLEQQTQWRQWLKAWQERHFRLPSVQCFSAQFAPNHQGLQSLLSLPEQPMRPLPELEGYQTWQVQLPKVVLEHLLFVLDEGRRSGQLPIWWVKGEVLTQEYVNPVAIECSVLHWQTDAGVLSPDDPSMGQLWIAGVDLSAELLQGMLSAALAQGEIPVVSVEPLDKK